MKKNMKMQAIGSAAKWICLLVLFFCITSCEKDPVPEAGLIVYVGNGDSGDITQTETFTVNGVSFTMVAVKGGTFTMGATSEQGSDADDDEKPTHRVTLSDYCIGQTEVTQELWQAVMGSNPSRFGGSKLPVEKVSWNDCQQFIAKLNRLTGKTFRLPTEAEWEYAARGGNKGRGCKYSGSNSIGDVAWYKDNSGDQTHPVGTKSPNELGLYDMSGNVYEWCQDWYGDYGSGSQTDPQGPSSGLSRVLRGGSWYFYAGYCRVSFRNYGYPDNRGGDGGLRLVMELENVPMASTASVSTASVSDIQETSATCGGNVTAEGGAAVTARGVCWSTSPDPTVSDSHTTNGTGTGSFTSNLTGLMAGTTYYVRAYATNSVGTAYGEQRSFKTATRNADQTFTVGGVSFKMVAVQGGTFSMGATSEQGSDAYDTEKPVHSVTLSDYFIGETEVTQALWQAVMGSNPSNWKGDNLPVECVSWNDCQQFIAKLNQLTGKTFRLPTEAEWEYAARGGNRSKGYKYSGSNSVNDVAWNEDNSGNQTHPVGTKSPNELGLYDMSGNVWEYCQDWFGSYGSGFQTNPQGPSSGSYRVLRGGSFYYYVRNCRVSFRNYESPDFRYATNYGLRLAL